MSGSRPEEAVGGDVGVQMHRMEKRCDNDIEDTQAMSSARGLAMTGHYTYIN